MNELINKFKLQSELIRMRRILAENLEYVKKNSDSNSPEVLNYSVDIEACLELISGIATKLSKIQIHETEEQK